MRKLSLLLGVILTCACAGCGDDRYDLLISDTIGTLKDTTRDVEQITKIVGEAVNKAKNDKKPLDPEHVEILKAIEEAGKLKVRAKRLQDIKAHTESRQEAITQEQREEYAKKHKASFKQAMIELDSAQKKLEATVREAEQTEADETSKSALESLRKKLKEMQDEFEVLTKRQS